MADDVSVGRAVQAVRLSRNLRQADVAARAGLSRTTVSRLERGQLDGLTVAALRAISRAVGMPPVVSVGWRRPEVERLLDCVHASLVEATTSMLGGFGWAVAPEHSFNHYGERGSVDILAWHPASRTLLVIETKSRLWDLQDTLSTLDRKRRVAPSVAAQALGWRALHVGAILVMPESRSHRRVVERHAATFAAAFPARQVEVRNWLRAPRGDLRGLWFLTNDREAVTRQRAGPMRARRRRAGRPRTTPAGQAGPDWGLRGHSGARQNPSRPSEPRPVPPNPAQRPPGGH